MDSVSYLVRGSFEDLNNSFVFYPGSDLYCILKALFYTLVWKSRVVYKSAFGEYFSLVIILSLIPYYIDILILYDAYLMLMDQVYCPG